MSQSLSIGRADLVRSIGATRLDQLLGEPFAPDEPNRVDKMAEHLVWACDLGVAELSLYIDLKRYPAEHTGLYREYAALFAIYHLERATSTGASQKSSDAYDATHKNLGLAHKGERLPGEREQRSVTTAQAIKDETQWSHDKLHGLV